MPFINTKFTGEINEAQQEAIKTALGKAVEVLGKTESWLMVGFEQDCALYFRGNKPASAAFVEVSIYGKASPAACDSMTAEICRILTRELAVPADMIYVKYSPTEQWGWNGGNF